MTTDLISCFDLLDRFPDLRLLADLSHFLVGREFADPVSEENHGYIHRALDNSCRRCMAESPAASRFRSRSVPASPQIGSTSSSAGGTTASARGEAGRRRRYAFLRICELGPQPYAIAGPDGNDLSDRWSDALILREEVTALFERTAAEAR